MIQPAPPKVPPPHPGHNRSRARASAPRREQLRGTAIEVLQRGPANKADLWLVDLGAGPLVIKDFSAKAWWVRLLGRVQISRECRAYRWLGPLPDLPPFLGRVDAHALALGHVAAVRLADSPARHERGAALLGALGQAVARLHASGLAHLDLRSRENVLLGADDRIYLLDLASAVWFRPGGLAHRLFFRLFKVTDDAALLKWKRLLGGGPYTEAEEAFLRRYRFWRALWIFNRKRTAPAGGDE